MSFQRCCYKSGAAGAQVLLGQNVQALKTFPRVLSDTCFDVSTGRRLGNITSGDDGQLASSARTQHVSKVAKVGLK